jgi:hypothetical protein
MLIHCVLLQDAGLLVIAGLGSSGTLASLGGAGVLGIDNKAALNYTCHPSLY